MFLIVWHLFSLLLSSKATLANNISISSQELNALYDFFYLTNGSYWVNNKGWNSLLNESGVVSDPCRSPGWYDI